MLKPLAKIPLTFLTDPNVELGESPYDVPPWTNGPYRHLCGLKPLQDDDTDGSDDAGESEDQNVEVGEGFILTDQAMQSMSENNKIFFTPEARQKITQFLTHACKHGQQLRQAQVGLKNKKKRRAKKTSHADSSDEETFVDRVENMPGYAEFKGASLAMQNRAGGVITETIKIMKDMDRTPMMAWKSYVYTSQVLPSRSEKKLSDEERQKKRQQEIDAKKTELKFYKPPPIGKYLEDRLIIRVASALFGRAAFMESGEILWDPYRRMTKSTIGRAWERESREAEKTLKKTIKMKKAYEKALEAATSTPCPRLLHKASECLQAWKDLAEITGEATESSFTTSVKKLEDLWGDLGYSSDPTEPGGKYKISRAGRNPRRALATPEQMEAAYASYRERHFCEMDGAINEMTEVLVNFQDKTTSDSDPVGPIPVDLLQGAESGDLGVDEFAQTPMIELLRLLGISNAGTLPLASEHFKMQWHQLVGIATMLKRMFTANLGDIPYPTLLCDEVGVGKTPQILGIICMLVHCIELQDSGKPLPPLLAESGRPYFAGREKMERLPSVVVVPLGLIPQWYQQLKHFTTEGAFQVIVYSMDQFDAVSFFEPGGIWDKHSKGKNAHRTIILVSVSTIAAEAKKHLGELDKGAAGRNRALRGEIRELGSDIATILNKMFLFFAGDEVHNFRNLNWPQLGAQQIAANSLVRLGASATPIFTGSKDLLALGRILRHVTMIGDAGYELGMDMLKSEQTRRRQYKREEEASEDGPSQSNSIRTQEASNPQDDFLAKRLATVNASRHRTFFIHCEAIDMAKKELMPIVIRRTGKSKDPAGQNILNLEPFYESIVWSAQREHEMQAVQKLKEALIKYKNEGDTKEMQVIWKNFLLDHKKTLFHWLLAEWKPEDPAFWMTWTAESLKQDASSKILMTINLTQHYQSPDAKPLFFNMDGTRDLTKEEECDCKPANKPRKIIIFVMYIIHRQIMKRALSLIGIQSVEYDGRMTPAKRDDTLKEFETNDNIRVLLMSNVGTTGLNLTTASVIIFLSGLWSGMEIKQTIGRIWRAGQTLPVIVHHIFAPGTADVILAALAGDKVLMLDHLYEVKTIADKIFNVHEGQDDTDTEWQGEDDGSSSSLNRVVKSKVPVRPRKHVPSVDPQSKPMNEPEPEIKLSEEEDKRASDSSSHVVNSKAPARPRKRPIPVMPEDENKNEEKNGNEKRHEQEPENNFGSQSQSTEANTRPSKKTKTSSTVIESISAPIQSPLTTHQLVSSTSARSLSPIGPAVQTRTSSPPCPPSPVLLHSLPHIETPPHDLPSHQGSSPVHIQLQEHERRAVPTANSSGIDDPKPTTGPPPSQSMSNLPRPPPWLETSAASSSQGQPRDPRGFQPPKQFPGQFKRKGPGKPTLAVKPHTKNTSMMLSPPPNARPSRGAFLRRSTSPQNSKGKGKQD